MPTEAIYQKDAFVKEFDATVTGVADGGIVLDRTAFYPGGGGQPCDFGTVAFDGKTAKVTKVGRKDGEIVHEIEGPSTGSGQGELPTVGSKVHGVVDWENRNALMRTHTALHILCGVIWRDFGAHVTGGNMTPLAARMDFELENMSADFAERVEELANAEIAKDRPISVKFMSRAEANQVPDLIRTKVSLIPEGITEIRVVDIDGLDMQADGGTHVASTKDVGRIRIVGHESKGRINKRLRLQIEDA